MAKTDKLTSLRPQRANANKHTERGLGTLRDSLQRDGWIGAMTVAADGETFDGSARLEVGVDAGFDDAIVVESDGTRPVIVKRVDIPNADHEKAKRLGVAANRVAQLDLAWDGDVLAQLESEGDLLSGLFSADELLVELGQKNRDDLDYFDDSGGGGMELSGDSQAKSGNLLPLPIMLTKKQMAAWNARKDEIEIRDDTRAFLEIVELEAQ